MKVLVTHISLNSAGGGEVVCLAVIKALRESGNSVTLATVDKTDWSKLNRMFNETTVPNEEFYLFSSMPKTSSNILNSAFLVALFLWELLLLKLTKKHHLILNTCGEKIDTIADIAYVNGVPLRCASSLPATDVKRKCMSILYNFLLRAFDKVDNCTVVANSRFDKTLIEKCTRKTVLVVYPPVKVRKFKHLAAKRRSEDIVLTFSQYLQSQNLVSVPMIAKNVNNASFLIVGPSGSTSKDTLDKLHRLIAELSTEGSVKLLTDQPFTKLLELLSRAKVFLRTLHHEPFGISVVEAMAAGCVPVVPRNGGPWFDILDQSQGKYGYSYQTIEEAASLVSMLLANEKLRIEVSNRARLRAMDFDSAIFERKILKILERIYMSKFRALNPKTTEPT